VLWDLDYTLVNARGLGSRLYEVVFREMFGRELPAVAPKAGRTDRAIIADTLALAGIPADREQVDRFIAALGAMQPRALMQANDFERAEVKVDFSTPSAPLPPPQAET